MRRIPMERTRSSRPRERRTARTSGRGPIAETRSTAVFAGRAGVMNKGRGSGAGRPAPFLVLVVARPSRLPARVTVMAADRRTDGRLTRPTSPVELAGIAKAPRPHIGPGHGRDRSSTPARADRGMPRGLSCEIAPVRGASSSESASTRESVTVRRRSARGLRCVRRQHPGRARRIAAGAEARTGCSIGGRLRDPRLEHRLPDRRRRAASGSCGSSPETNTRYVVGRAARLRRGVRGRGRISRSASQPRAVSSSKARAQRSSSPSTTTTEGCFAGIGSRPQSPASDAGKRDA